MLKSTAIIFQWFTFADCIYNLQFFSPLKQPLFHISGDLLHWFFFNYYYYLFNTTLLVTLIWTFTAGRNLFRNHSFFLGGEGEIHALRVQEKWKRHHFLELKTSASSCDVERRFVSFLSNFFRGIWEENHTWYITKAKRSLLNQKINQW